MRAAMRHLRYTKGTMVFALLLALAAFFLGVAFPRRRLGQPPVVTAPANSALPPEVASQVHVDEPAPPEPAPPSSPIVEPASGIAIRLDAPGGVRFDPIASRGTRSVHLADHSPEWRGAMLETGERFAAEEVSAIVFVHGTFMGSDPLSAYRVVERALPTSVGPFVAARLRQMTRAYVERVVGDVGNFGSPYVRLFESALRPAGARIPCTEFVWSSENHHVGRLEGALGLVRVLATHAELAAGAHRRLLVVGHSHAGQLFALTTQLLAGSLATEAIFDIARARGLDVGALEVDLDTLGARVNGVALHDGAPSIDFVTFGAPNRYAWADIPHVRALHVVAASGRTGEGGDLVQRLGAQGSDFPPLRIEERRLNARLAEALGHSGFAPLRVATALRGPSDAKVHGDVVFVDYGETGLFAVGRAHGIYTRLDGMLFHATLIADRLYARREAEPDRRLAVQGK